MTYLNKHKVFCSVFSLLLWANHANAIDVQQYEKLKANSLSDIKLYVFGVGYGYQWSNTMLKLRGDPLFFCSPNKISLNADNYISILDSRISSLTGSEKKDEPVELILYKALVETFPCQTKQ